MSTVKNKIKSKPWRSPLYKGYEPPTVCRRRLTHFTEAKKHGPTRSVTGKARKLTGVLRLRPCDPDDRSPRRSLLGTAYLVRSHGPPVETRPASNNTNNTQQTTLSGGAFSFSLSLSHKKKRIFPSVYKLLEEAGYLLHDNSGRNGKSTRYDTQNGTTTPGNSNSKHPQGVKTHLIALSP